VGAKSMEWIILGITVGILIAAYNFGRNVLFSLQTINEHLHSIEKFHENISSQLYELNAQAETLSGRNSRELIGDNLKKSIERTTGVRL
jgi:peptidoglycan hydrolase CwlO-like protein